MKSRSLAAGVILSLVFSGIALPILAQEKPTKQDPPVVHAVALLPFQERGSGVKGYGGKVNDLLFASLAAGKRQTVG